MEKSESIKNLAIALIKAQAEVKVVEKGAENPFFKSKYADLASVWEVCRKPLADNGLCIIQSVTSDSEHHYVETLMAHLSGQWLNDTVRLTLKDDTMQGLGSGITYARRYQLAAFAGVAPDDDVDGNAASGKKQDVKPDIKPQDARTATKPTPPVQSDGQEAQLKRISEGFAILGVTTQVDKGKRVREWGLHFDTQEGLDAIEAKINELVNLK
jgi:hypothetical protein